MNFCLLKAQDAYNLQIIRKRPIFVGSEGATTPLPVIKRS
jgi:hypothetical protein